MKHTHFLTSAFTTVLPLISCYIAYYILVLPFCNFVCVTEREGERVGGVVLLVT